MDPATLNGTTTNFTVKTATGGVSVPGTVSYNASTRIATFTPTQPAPPATALLPGTSYTVTITPGAKDLAGLGLAGNFSFSFRTAP
jgi:hypothetical protein